MIKLQNDYTTPEQSKRLLELGVPEWTANWRLSKLVKDSHGQKPIDKHNWVVNRKDYTHMIVGFMKYDYLPCWSVGRLIEIWSICCVEQGHYLGTNSTNHHILTTDEVIEMFSWKTETGKPILDFSKLEE